LSEAVPLLEIDNMHSYYGHIHALRGISLMVEEGEVVTLIGSNGAGKTTTLRSIHGILPPREGKIVFNGEEIQGTPAHELIGKGIAQSPEGRRIFFRMTVLENLEMGAYHRDDTSEIRQDMDRVFDLFPRLKERTKQEAGTMSGGEQQMLAIGRALMSRPKLLLLDEPSMGLAPVLVERIFEIIREINNQGTTILLVEQNANVALEIATRGYVLETGAIVNSASAGELREDPSVREAYLGEI
jgi:branched-chain amino acid transport system ATP-binding protein